MEYQLCKKVPNLLRKYRKSRGLKQEQVAAILGLKSASRISRWEKGKCLPSLKHAIRLTFLYRTMMDGLFRDLSHALHEEVREGEAKVVGIKTLRQ